MTLEQMDKQKQQYIDFNNQLNNNNQVNAPSGSNEEWWASGSGGNAPSPGASNGGGMSNVGNNNYIMNGRTFPPTQHDEVPGYYDVKLGGTTRPTRQPTKRPTNKPSINAEQAMHRYSFCGAFWTDVSLWFVVIYYDVVLAVMLITLAHTLHNEFTYETNKNNRQETTARRRNTVKMIVIVPSLSSVGRRLHVITTRQRHQRLHLRRTCQQLSQQIHLLRGNPPIGE